MADKNSCAVIVFGRYPEIGKVKTRLAKEIGEEPALKFYKFSAENTFAECKKIKSENILLYLFFSEVKDKASVAKWTGNDFTYFSQSGSNLGERMYNAFLEIFSKGIKKAVIIGTDIPEINSEIIKQSCELLNYTDSVIGPAADGGYYLLGMKNPHKFLFENINWSTGSVFSETKFRIMKNKLSFFVLKELGDIDTKEDYIRWSEKNKH